MPKKSVNPTNSVPSGSSSKTTHSPSPGVRGDENEPVANCSTLKDPPRSKSSASDSSCSDWTSCTSSSSGSTSFTSESETDETSSSNSSEFESGEERSLSCFTIQEKVPRADPVARRYSSLSAVGRLEERKNKFYEKGEIVKERYFVGECIGEGTFGQVTAAIDLTSNQRVALKIITNPKRHSMARDEIRILRKLKELDPRDRYHWVQMLTSFNYEGHFFVVFELLGPSLYEYQKAHKYAPYDVVDIRHIAYQVCQSVGFLHKNRIAHTDLKPENIVFVDQCIDGLTDTKVKLIDFGSAYFEEDEFTGTISTRHYRAPEVVLRTGWSYPSDVWSIGCILYEAYTGDVLFPRTAKNLLHLAMMESTLGPLPASLLNKTEKKEYFRNGKVNVSATEAQTIKSKCPPFWSACEKRDADRQLFKLIQKMLAYDPKRRISCEEAVKDVFFA